MNNIELFIILVNWNKAHLTLNCIKSINNSTYINYQIIVVDNNSLDNSLELLESSNLNFHLIKNSENLGYTGGNNIGIKFALTKNPKYILLLNNDTLIKNNCISELVYSLYDNQKIGIVQPKIFFHPEVEILWSGPTNFNKFLLKPKLLGYKSKKSESRYNSTQFLDYAVGCATLIKTEVFLNVGLLDDDYFAVCEDVDFGLRAKAAGFKILYNPSAIVYHLESASAGGSDNPVYVYYQTRSYLILFSKWKRSFFQYLMSFLIYTFSNMIRIFKLLLKGNYRACYAIILGYLDFFKKKYGKQFHKQIT